MIDEESQQIHEMEALARLFSDPTVRNAVERLRKDYAVHMLAAATSEDREKVWVKARALEELLQEFQSTSQNGKLAKIKQEKAKAVAKPRTGNPPAGR